MTLISLIFLIISFGHILLGLILVKRYPRNNNKLHSFSVIVVSHNEEKMIIPLIESLLKLDYPQDMLEVILVDDNSTDKTWDIINDYALKFSNIKAIRTNAKYQKFKGKKAGLQSAIDIAQNDIIALTDADASLPANWLKSHNSLFNHDTGLVIGYIRGINIKGISRYKRIFSSGLFASFCALGNPFSCSGGNLAIRKEALHEVGGYSSIKDFPSGDDKQMLNLIKKSNYRIVYNSQVKVIERERRLSKDQLYQQAIRHYGKASISSLSYQIGFIIIILFYLALPIISFFNPFILLYFWLGNIIFYSSSLLYHKEKLYLNDIFLAIIYPYYMLYFSLMGTFKEAKWKK